MKRLKKEYILLALILFLTFLFRFPSLFEPFWYGDEGIFAAVANNLNQGGILYQTAWDNKPPMIYLTYAAIFKFFGVSMFWLHLVTIIVVLTTAAVIYEIAQKIIGTRRALVVTFVFGFLTSLRIVEGNLALTEIFMILPVSLAMFLIVKRNFDLISIAGAGFLFAIASLYKQVGALEAAAVGIFLFLYTKRFGEFLKRGLVLALGFAVPYFATIAYFLPKHLVGDYVFAAYTYYRIYLGESPKYALLINILKFLPIVSVIVYGFWRKAKNDLSVFYLFLLWTAFSFLGSFFSGRTYGHYLVQAIPAVSLLFGSISLKPKIERVQIIFALFFFVPLIFLTKLLFTDFLSGGSINQVGYFRNFIDFSLNKKDLGQYNDYFDKNVTSTMALDDFFALRNARSAKVYIWRDYPWLYAVADLKNPTRYVTSFHVFGVPKGSEEVIEALSANPPDYIIKPSSSIGYFVELEKLLAKKYTKLVKIENSNVYVKRNI